MTRIVLASGSPRRKELLDHLGVSFEIRVPDIDEAVRAGETSVAYVRRLAVAKADVVAAAFDADVDVDVDVDVMVIAADTTVDLDGRILGKPVDVEEATAMLTALSARTHRVHTGLAVSHAGLVLTDVVTTMVTMTPIRADAIRWYVATGEPFDKAGGYAVQGAAGVFVQRIAGSVSNVVGLPLHTVARLAGELGVPLFGHGRGDGAD